MTEPILIVLLRIMGIPLWLLLGRTSRKRLSLGKSKKVKAFCTIVVCFIYLIYAILAIHAGEFFLGNGVEDVARAMLGVSIPALLLMFYLLPKDV